MSDDDELEPLPLKVIGTMVAMQKKTYDATVARIAELEAENKRLAETGQLNVLADIREIVDPMSPGRMMQKELVERIREIMAENARLAAIVEKLPKTADGVPIVPGMKVWWLSYYCGAIYGFVTDRAVSIDALGGSYQNCHQCYSTEAAALAAKERA